MEELLAEASLSGEGAARRLLGDLAYRSAGLKEEFAHRGVLLATEKAERWRGERQHVEVCFAALKRVFGLGETLAKTLVGLALGSGARVVLVNRDETPYDEAATLRVWTGHR